MDRDGFNTKQAYFGSKIKFSITFLGVQVVIVLKRRIINEMMTTYLPTLLILIIVYSTNFFQHFFFEAVVTVNLTALLVLTTLFISVSGLYI